MNLDFLDFLHVENFLGILKNASASTIWLTYTILGIVAIFENVVPPIPGDTIVIIGSVLVGMDILNFYILLLFTSIGSIIGFMTVFYVAGLLGKEFLIKRKWVGEKKLNSFIKYFKPRAYFLILVNRFVFTFRSSIAVIAGILKLEYKQVFFLASISSISWNYLLIYLGYKAGEHWGDIINLLKKYNFYFFIFMILFLLFYFLVYNFFLEKTKKKLEYDDTDH